MTLLYGVWYSFVLRRLKNNVKLLPQSAEKWICMGKWAFENLGSFSKRRRPQRTGPFYPSVHATLVPGYLCKRAQGDSHFRGHVSPMFCNMSPFFFCVTRSNKYLILWFFFFLWSFWLRLPFQSWCLCFFNVLNHRSLLWHITVKFQLNSM